MAVPVISRYVDEISSSQVSLEEPEGNVREFMVAGSWCAFRSWIPVVAATVNWHKLDMRANRGQCLVQPFALVKGNSLVQRAVSDQEWWRAGAYVGQWTGDADQTFALGKRPVEELSKYWMIEFCRIQCQEVGVGAGDSSRPNPAGRSRRPRRAF